MEGYSRSYSPNDGLLRTIQAIDLYSLALFKTPLPLPGLDLQNGSQRVDWLTSCDGGGTSRAGFSVKKPSGLRVTLTRSTGMIGKSSIRGL